MPQVLGRRNDSGLPGWEAAECRGGGVSGPAVGEGSRKKKKKKKLVWWGLWVCDRAEGPSEGPEVVPQETKV